MEVPLGTDNDAHAQMTFIITLKERVDVHSEHTVMQAEGDSQSFLN